MKTILVGAVAYDPRVVTIWDIIKDFFIAKGCPIDYILYSNYEIMQDALVHGDIDIAWNSPLAWLDLTRKTKNACRAIAMRDTDRDRVSHILVRKESGIDSLSDLSGKTIAVGAKDSPQATLIPLNLLHNAGVTDLNVVRHDVLVGKHGDHIGGELNALKDLQAGRAEACAVLDLNWQLWSANGTADPNQIVVLATTPPFDHCVFAVRADFPLDVEQHWREVLFRMDYNNPDHKEMMDLEGLKRWEPGRVTGFAQLTEATERQGFWQ
jgi:ABC-type phosphate/phosphonate transport system substrate-binding protein